MTREPSITKEDLAQEATMARLKNSDLSSNLKLTNKQTKNNKMYYLSNLNILNDVYLSTYSLCVCTERCICCGAHFQEVSLPFQHVSLGIELGLSDSEAGAFTH